MNDIDYIAASVRDSIAVKEEILADKTFLKKIEDVANLCTARLQAGNRILLAGNGGSAADAQHLAAEFVSRFMYDRPGLASMSFTTDTSMLTAIGNDYGYEYVFERQLEANARPGDVFIGLSTSGNSKNVLRAILRCRELGVHSVGLTGSGGEIRQQCEYSLAVPSASTPRIQESHILVGHIICGLVEQNIFPKNAG